MTDLILGVLGCMAERDGIDMLRRYPQIDLLCGPGELDKLPMLIDNVVRTAAQASPSADDVPDRVALAGKTSKGPSPLDILTLGR
mgnify:CR=1 FL=1